VPLESSRLFFVQHGGDLCVGKSSWIYIAIGHKDNILSQVAFYYFDIRDPNKVYNS